MTCRRLCNLITKRGSLRCQCVPTSSFQARPASIEMAPHLTTSEQDLITQARGKRKHAMENFMIAQQKLAKQIHTHVRFVVNIMNVFSKRMFPDVISQLS